MKKTIDAELRAAPRLAADAHKGDAGRVLCVVGSETMPGAAVLVARAAQRAGAGLVCVGCLDPGLLRIVPVAAPEAVLSDMRAAFAIDGRGEAPGGRVAELFLARAPHARLVGPGIGDDARARAVVAAALACGDGHPLVLDADALNALDGRPEALREAAGPVVVTPHPGEAARLLGRAAPDDEAGRVEFARELARRAGAVTCLKGHGTVVTDGERVHVNRTGNPGMASAGAGDVLSGILVAYLARGVAAGDVRFGDFEAAAAAVHVHGAAGDLARERLGTSAVIASDLIAELGRAQRAFEERGAGS